MEVELGLLQSPQCEMNHRDGCRILVLSATAAHCGAVGRRDRLSGDCRYRFGRRWSRWRSVNEVQFDFLATLRCAIGRFRSFRVRQTGQALHPG